MRSRTYILEKWGPVSKYVSTKEKNENEKMVQYDLLVVSVESVESEVINTMFDYEKYGCSQEDPIIG